MKSTAHRTRRTKPNGGARRALAAPGRARRVLAGASAAAALVLLAACAQSSSGGGSNLTAANFFKGKTITLVVPNAPGGDMDVSARMIAPYLQKAVGASAIKVLDIKGAGGVIGLNQLWGMPHDGYTIAYTSIPTVITTSLLNGSAVKYDATKFVYIGRASTAPRVLVVSKKSGITDLSGLQHASSVTMSIQGFDDDFYTQAALAASLGIHVKYISGFDSLAQETVSVGNGSTMALEASLASQSSVIQSGLVRPVVMLNPTPVSGYESVPTWASAAPPSGQGLASAFESLITLGRSFFAPPGIPAAARQALTDGLAKALKDPALAAQMNKAQIPPAFMSGMDEQAAVARIVSGLRPTLAPLKSAQAQVQG